MLPPATPPASDYPSAVIPRSHATRNSSSPWHVARGFQPVIFSHCTAPRPQLKLPPAVIPRSGATRNPSSLWHSERSEESLCAVSRIPPLLFPCVAPGFQPGILSHCTAPGPQFKLPLRRHSEERSDEKSLRHLSALAVCHSERSEESLFAVSRIPPLLFPCVAPGF